MRILQVHNEYQIRGGEDVVVEFEQVLLESNGCEVEQFLVSNNSISSLYRRIIAFIFTPYSFVYEKKLVEFINCYRPDVVHVHNYFPLLSPSVFRIIKNTGTPIVHTLHNYRSVCPTALLMHKGMIEEKSVYGPSWWCITKRVYRDSLFASFALSLMVELHKNIGTWITKVDRYIALTGFSNKKYVEAGWPKDKVCVKSNSIIDPFDGDLEINKAGGYALFVGRLSEEKGVCNLLSSWNNVDYKLKVIGDGPLKSFVENNCADGVEYLGLKDKVETLELIKNADFIVMPSTWYEGFPMVLVEAFACGTPAVVSQLGSMEEIVVDGVTGLHFEAGNEDDLALKIRSMIESPERARKMGMNARREYLSKYTPEINYNILMDIYKQAIEEAKRN